MRASHHSACRVVFLHIVSIPFTVKEIGMRVVIPLTVRTALDTAVSRGKYKRYTVEVDCDHHYVMALTPEGLWIVVMHYNA